MQPTSEQHGVITHDFNENPVLKVFAFAGAGKTTVLVEMAKCYPNAKILYLAYNRPIRDEAEKKFPKQNTHCKTGHQLAFRDFGLPFSKKEQLTGNLKLKDISRAIGSNNWLVVKAVEETLVNYMASADPSISQEHLPENLVSQSFDRESKVTAQDLERTLQGAKKIWSKMTDINDAFPIVHDAYLKLYQLSEPDLSQYDLILFDEAQDANPVITDIVMRQSACKVFVGDTHQQIYRFRGAEDAMHSKAIEDGKSLYLTGSFRFGSKVAHVANSILKVALGETAQVQGLSPEKDGFMKAEAFEKMLLSPGHKGELLSMSRTGASVIEEAFEAIDAQKTVYWMGGPQGYGLDDLLDLYNLGKEDFGRIRNKKLLKDYSSLAEYREVADESSDVEMNKLVKLLDRYSNIPAMVAKVKRFEAKNKDEADLIVSTAHRAKGLEARFCKISNDWLDLEDPDALVEKSREQFRDEMNLLYVASTRAKVGLVPNSAAIHLMKSYRDWQADPDTPRLSIAEQLPSEKKGIHQAKLAALATTQATRGANMEMAL